MAKKVKLVLEPEDAELIKTTLDYALWVMNDEPKLQGDVKIKVLQTVEEQITNIEQAIKEAEDG